MKMSVYQKLHTNNMTDATSKGYRWEYTYNENGLPETIETKWVDIPTEEPMLFTITYKQKVSIDEAIKNLTVSIFPNPTVSDFTVSFELLEKSCNLQISLCDILGKELLEVYNDFVSAGNFTRTVNTENLAKGIYFLKILIDGNSTVEKIVIGSRNG